MLSNISAFQLYRSSNEQACFTQYFPALCCYGLQHSYCRQTNQLGRKIWLAQTTTGYSPFVTLVGQKFTSTQHPRFICNSPC